MYQLSEKTSIDVRYNSTYKTHYVAFVRAAREDAKERWINISKKAWLALHEVAVDVYHAAEMFPDDSDEAKIFPLNENIFLKLSRYQGLVYVGLHHKKGPYNNVMNMNQDEWLQLTVHEPNIHAHITGATNTPQSVPKQQQPKPVKRVRKSAVKNEQQKGGIKKLKLKPQKLDFTDDNACDGYDECGSGRPMSSGQTPVLYQYRWHILRAGGDYLSPLTSSVNWTFIEDVCRAEGQATLEAKENYYGCIGDALALTVEKREHILPHPLELFKMAYTHLLRKEARIQALKKCTGCVNSWPSQLDHMGQGGCLVEEAELVAAYMDDATKQLDLAVVLDLIKTVYVYFAVPVPAIFEEPPPSNLPTVTSADVHTYCLMGLKDYETLFEHLIKQTA